MREKRKHLYVFSNDNCIKKSVIGPDGNPMTLKDLPPPNTKRWVVRRKAEVVFAVSAGLLTLKQACKRYKLSEEEFSSWKKLIGKYGMRGLRVTRTQKYRNQDPYAPIERKHI